MYKRTRLTLVNLLLGTWHAVYPSTNGFLGSWKHPPKEDPRRFVIMCHRNIFRGHVNPKNENYIEYALASWAQHLK